MSVFVPRSHVSFTERLYLEKYPIRMPSFTADWDVWEYWERERIQSMVDNLKEGDLLMEVGTESGWMSIALAKIVGPESLILVESTPEYWPNIRATWEENFIDALPRATYWGLLDSAPNSHADFSLAPWPEVSETGMLTTARSYRYLHQHADITPISTVDQLCGKGKLKPKALTIDVEGAEFRVLRGARVCLQDLKPLVWISIHPDLMLRDYSSTPTDIHNFMADLGYEGQLLHIDHETHYLFRP